MPEPSYTSHTDHRAMINAFKDGNIPPDGPVGSNFENSRPAKHKINRAIINACRNHLASRGKFFVAANIPYYLDEVVHRLYLVDARDNDFITLLRKWSLFDGEMITKLVANEIISHALGAPIHDVHRLSCMSATAIYIWASRSTMYRITSSTIEQVFIGTDDVVLINDDLADLPGLDSLRPHIDTIRPILGDSCTQLHPGLPITDIITSRWAKDAALAPDQAQQMFITRFLFMFSAASQTSLWPVTLSTGEQNSGKSTLYEIILTMLRGKLAEGKKLPSKVDDVVSSVSNTSYAVYDNADGAIFSRSSKDSLADIFCLIATGGEYEKRAHYHNNKPFRVNVRNHAALTARVNNLAESDLLRRTLIFPIEPPDSSNVVEKNSILKKGITHRAELFTEILLRCQNILRAYLAPEPTYRYQSQMAEYEAYTLRCAAYEGSLAEVEAIWSAYMDQFREAMAESNSMLWAIKLWLGKHPEKAAVYVTPTEIFTDLQMIHEETRQKMTYSNASRFGLNVNTNSTVLRTLNMDFNRTNVARFYSFSPSPDQLAECKATYEALLSSAQQRSNPLNPGLYGARFSTQTRPMPMDDGDDAPRFIQPEDV